MWQAIGSALGSALGVGGSIANMIMGNKAHKKYMGQLDKDEKENQNWFNRYYNEDVTQRHDNQLALTRAEDVFRKYINGERGKTAVAGGTEESAATAKANATAGISDAVAQVAAQGDARKDKIEEQYRARKQDISDKRAGAQAAQAQQFSDSIGQLTGVAGDLIAASAADTGSTKKKGVAAGETNSTDATGTGTINTPPSTPETNIGEQGGTSSIKDPYANVRSDFDIAKMANDDEEKNKIRGLA